MTDPQGVFRDDHYPEGIYDPGQDSEGWAQSWAQSWAQEPGQTETGSPSARYAAGLDQERDRDEERWQEQDAADTYEAERQDELAGESSSIGAEGGYSPGPAGPLTPEGMAELHQAIRGGGGQAGLYGRGTIGAIPVEFGPVDIPADRDLGWEAGT